MIVGVGSRVLVARGAHNLQTVVVHLVSEERSAGGLFWTASGG